MQAPETAQREQAGLKLKTSGGNRDSMPSPPCVILELRGSSQRHPGQIQRETLSEIGRSPVRRRPVLTMTDCVIWGAEGACGEEDPQGPILQCGGHLEILLALAGVAQWIDCWSVNQRATGSISSQGTCLGCGPGPHLGAWQRQSHIDISLPLFLPPFPSL